jgi:hypothetical protein
VHGEVEDPSRRCHGMSQSSGLNCQEHDLDGVFGVLELLDCGISLIFRYPAIETEVVNIALIKSVGGDIRVSKNSPKMSTLVTW